MNSVKIVNGGMGEWLKPAVLKTVSGETRSGVRIPLPPPAFSEVPESQRAVLHLACAGLSAEA